MNEDGITRITLDEAGDGETDWQRLDNMTEEEIEAGALSDPDNPPWTEEELANARFMTPQDILKVPISIRLDREIVEWFKAQGPRYQTRINAVLRSYVRSVERTTPGG